MGLSENHELTHLPQQKTRGKLSTNQYGLRDAFGFFLVSVSFKISFLIYLRNAWQYEECELVFRNSSVTTCECNHLTTFGVLVDTSKKVIRIVYFQLPARLIHYINTAYTTSNDILLF